MRKILLVPTSPAVALNKITENLTAKIAANKTALLRIPFAIPQIVQHLAANTLPDLLEEFAAEIATIDPTTEVLVMQGLELHEYNTSYAATFNLSLAMALDATVVFVSAIYPDLEAESKNSIRITVNPYLTQKCKVHSVILDNSRTNFAHPVDSFEFFFDMFATQLGYFDGIECSVDLMKLEQLTSADPEPRITPPLFFAQLMTKARQLNKKIVLPEGDEPRTLQAANICAERGLAQCILLGDAEHIQNTAQQLGLTLHKNLTIMDPAPLREQYATTLFELRKNKGLTLEDARTQVMDNVMFGTLMLQLDQVDGLVSGAIHTTANTIRPALQIIKTVPTATIVSSVFFVCLPSQVLVYGDCAINPNPTAEQLADIAIQSATSAATFGIAPKVALLSYSTGTSGAGPSVDVVAQAAKLANTLRPDLAIEGPIQYDAAVDATVAALKLPNSKVAGKTNVFIFPDLNAGNIACKAVQRSTNTICIGPMLQGLRKPVNDLSRGCSIDDIVFTITITAAQAATISRK